MKFVVVHGMVLPDDPAKKPRPAVVLGMVNGRVAVATCSSNYERSGKVPPGHVLLTSHSPSFAGSGLESCKHVLISIRDVGLYSIDSKFVRRCKQIGMLDTSLDKRLAENLQEQMHKYDLYQCVRQFN